MQGSFISEISFLVKKSFVYAVGPINSKHKRQRGCGNTNATKDRYYILVPKKGKNHLILSKKRYIGYANPAKGNSMCNVKKKPKKTKKHGNLKK